MRLCVRRQFASNGQWKRDGTSVCVLPDDTRGTGRVCVIDQAHLYVDTVAAGSALQACTQAVMLPNDSHHRDVEPKPCEGQGHSKPHSLCWQTSVSGFHTPALSVYCGGLTSMKEGSPGTAWP